jgi:hypothetical protein
MEHASALGRDFAEAEDGFPTGHGEEACAPDNVHREPLPGRPVAAVAELLKGATDCRGEPVDAVFFKRDDYAIYLSGGDVAIQYADDPVKAKQQIDATAELIPLRDRLRFMISGRQVPGCYRRHIADAFRLTLEGKPLVAEEILSCAIEDVLGYKARVGRTIYLTFAGPLALAVCMSLLAASMFAFNEKAPAVGHLLLAAAGGAMGALLSIAIALRTRTVAVDDDKKANRIDGLIRVLIGTISGGALMLVLVTGVVASVSMSMVKDGSADLAWQAALIVGFAAGFFERLVPDLLAKSFDSKPKVASSHAIGRQAS